MDEVWEIPSADEQRVIVLYDESQTTPMANDDWLEITEVDTGPYFVETGNQAIVGSVLHEINRQNEVVFGSDWGSTYVGKIDPSKAQFTVRSPVVTTSELHKGWYLARRVLVEFRPDPNTEEWRIPVQIPLLRIHRPHRSGCETNATARSIESNEASAEFEFLGIKGGAGVGFRTELSRKISAGSICKEEVIRATLIVEHGATLVDGQAVAYGSRYRIVEVDTGNRVTRQIPQSVDRCEKAPLLTPNPTPPFWAVFDKTGVPSGEPDTDEEGVKLGSTGYVNVGLGTDIGSVPLKLSVEMKRTLGWEFEVNTTLQGGAKYLRFPVSLSGDQSLPFEICWSVL